MAFIKPEYDDDSNMEIKEEPFDSNVDEEKYEPNDQNLCEDNSTNGDYEDLPSTSRANDKRSTKRPAQEETPSSGKRFKIKSCGKVIDFGDDISNSDHEYKPKKRGRRFSQKETDRLLSLVMSPEINHKPSNRGSRGWKKITASFNASPCVMPRGERELRDRISNIRKDLYKLSRYHKEMPPANDDGHLQPPRKAPSISFMLSDVVRKYALSLNVKLPGKAPAASDNASPPVDEASSKPATSEKSYLLENKVPVTAVKATNAASQNEIDQPQPSTLNRLTSTSLPFRSSLIHHRSKPNTDNTEVSHSNLNCSPPQKSAALKTSSTSSTQLCLDKKTQLLIDENHRRNDENERRNQWHTCCMEIKNQELAIKKKQLEFWSIIVNNVKQNPIKNILDIVNVGRAMDVGNPISYDVSFPSGEPSSPGPFLNELATLPNDGNSNVDVVNEDHPDVETKCFVHPKNTNIVKSAECLDNSKTGESYEGT